MRQERNKNNNHHAIGTCTDKIYTEWELIEKSIHTRATSIKNLIKDEKEVTTKIILPTVAGMKMVYTEWELI